MLKPLSISLEKLRRAQRSLIRRKRGSKVKVSFPHQQPAAYLQRRQHSREKAPPANRPPRTDPPWIRRPYNETSAGTQYPVACAPVRWVEDHRPVQQARKPRHALRKRTPYPVPTPYPLRQDDGCCDDSFDGTKQHRYWGNIPEPDVSAPLNAKLSARPPPGPSTGPTRPLRQAAGYHPRYLKNEKHRRTSRNLDQPGRATVRAQRDEQLEKPSILQTPEAYYRKCKPTPNSKRCGIADPEV